MCLSREQSLSNVAPAVEHAQDRHVGVDVIIDDDVGRDDADAGVVTEHVARRADGGKVLEPIEQDVKIV